MAKYPSETQDKFMLRLPEGMRGDLKEKAGKERRSMNSEIILALEAWLSAEKAEDRPTA